MAQSKSEKSNMFIRVGNRLLNSQYIVEIRPRSHAHGEDNATIILHDGTTHTGFMPESAINALAEQIIPALPGYEAYVQYNLDFDYDVDDEIPPQLEWKPVVAFIYEPGSSLLVPITVDDGRLNDYAVRSPSGKVHTSSERFFENVEEYREYLCKELAKKRTKAA
jgi:hypothetical protein